MKNYIFPFLWMRGESEEIIREEIEKIYECGIRAVCVEARPHDDFCGPGWWHDMDIVIDEAKKRDMKIWILDDKHFPTGYANGLIEKKYPERKKQYIACTTADIFGGQHQLTLNVTRMLKPTIGFWEIGLPADYEERAKNSLISIVAARFEDGNNFKEDIIDLTDTFDGTNATFNLPQGQWRVHVIYKTRTDGGNDTYINMIDKVSAHTQIEGVYEEHFNHYGEEFGKTIAGFFSDEPQFGNISDQCFDTKLGKAKMPLPWSDELEELLKERYGEAYKKFLPFLFVETEEMELCPKMRYDYMDCISKLYEQNFSRPIGEWCESHGVEYIGHVVEDNSVHSRLGLGAAHWFRAMAGQHMAGIDAIGGQVIFGAPAQTRKGMVNHDGEFYHYALGKMGASAGHLDPKKKGRTMCELFGAYGWSFGVRDMKYLLDHLLCKGVNHLVPHAFSMAEYPDYDCPPHFYARGNNPQFPWFVELMKYANRMCNLLNEGMHVASVAVLYDGEADWAGEHMSMQKVCRELIQNQIEFDIVCLDMLNDLTAYNGKVENGKMTINGVTFDALLISQADYIPEKLMQFVCANKEFPVYFVGGAPKGILGGERKEVLIQTIKLKDVSTVLRKQGFYKITLKETYPELSVYHYQKDKQIFMLQNESPNTTFCGTVMLPTSEDVLYYDAYKDVYYDMIGHKEDGRMSVELELAPGESCVLMEKGDIHCNLEYSTNTKIKSLCPVIVDISADWEVSKAKAKEYPILGEKTHMDVLHPISDENPTFSGIIRYEKKVVLDKQPQEAYLSAEHVYEVMRVWINGKLVGTKLTPDYRIFIGEELQAGENEIVVEVASTPARDQLNYPMPPFDFSHEALEPTGMFGRITLSLEM